MFLSSNSLEVDPLVKSLSYYLWTKILLEKDATLLVTGFLNGITFSLQMGSCAVRLQEIVDALSNKVDELCHQDIPEVLAAGAFYLGQWD